jgi:hypothetical protein
VSEDHDSLSQIGTDGKSSAVGVEVKLGSNPEGVLDESYLPEYVVLGQPPHLPLPNHVHRFVAFNGS